MEENIEIRAELIASKNYYNKIIDIWKYMRGINHNLYKMPLVSPVK